MSDKKTVESNLKENLNGDVLTSALDFATFMKNMGMTADDGARFCYKDELMCIIISYKNDTSGGWCICDCPFHEHDGFTIDENVKNFAQANIQKCRGDVCGCDHKERGATKMIFGKEYDNLCSSEIVFNNPDTEALKKIKILMEFWKFKLDNIDGYSSQDR